MESLYQRERRTNPRSFQTERIEIFRDANGLLESHACFGCVAYRSRNPVDCDPCSVNPDKDRLKRAGLL